MVSPNDVTTNGTAPSLPVGKYTLVGFDMDLTGRRLIDEIVHVAAYTPKSTFSQFVMPFRDLNIAAKYRHFLRVITVGRYRMLRSDKTGKILKTKSEISALTDFIVWLEGLGSSNIILLTHEMWKTVPLLLLDVLKKHSLYDRFCAIVKGFANTYVFAESKCAETVKSFTLFSLCTVLLDREEHMDSAADRARLTYEILQHLCAGEGATGDSDQEAVMGEAVRQIANTIAIEELNLAGLKGIVERQDSLKPIFGVMIKSRNHYERKRASNLRRLLAEANLTYQDLDNAWKENKKETLTKLIQDRVTKAKTPAELDELTETLLGHFDPEYKPNLPPRPPRRSERSDKTTDKEASAGEEKQSEDKSKNSSGKSSPGKFASATSSPAKTAGEVKDADTSR